MAIVTSQITGHSNVCPTVYIDWYQRKHQRSASLAFVRGINNWPVDSTHKRPVLQETFPCVGVIMAIWHVCCTDHFYPNLHSNFFSGTGGIILLSTSVPLETNSECHGKINHGKIKHGWVITSIIWCGMKLLMHSQTSRVVPLKFGNGQVISSRIL